MRAKGSSSSSPPFPSPQTQIIINKQTIPLLTRLKRTWGTSKQQLPQSIRLEINCSSTVHKSELRCFSVCLSASKPVHLPEQCPNSLMLGVIKLVSNYPSYLTTRWKGFIQTGHYCYFIMNYMRPRRLVIVLPTLRSDSSFLYLSACWNGRLLIIGRDVVSGGRAVNFDGRIYLPALDGRHHSR